MSSTIIFFVGFRVGSSDGKDQSDLVIISNPLCKNVVDMES